MEKEDLELANQITQKPVVKMEVLVLVDNTVSQSHEADLSKPKCCELVSSCTSIDRH